MTVIYYYRTLKIEELAQFEESDPNLHLVLCHLGSRMFTHTYGELLHLMKLHLEAGSTEYEPLVADLHTILARGIELGVVERL